MSHGLSEADHVVANVERSVELSHEDLTQDPGGAGCKTCLALRPGLRRTQMDGYKWSSCHSVYSVHITNLYDIS